MADKDVKDYCKTCNVEPPAMRFKCPECGHNPDNEQIVIDGVDISGCEFIDEWKHCDICNSLIKTVYQNATKCLTEQDLRCETYQNCHYKQLKRKEQECEELKESNKKAQELYKYFMNVAESTANKNKELENNLHIANTNHEAAEKECDRYLEALEEIEDFRKKHCDFLCEGNRILDIINKAKGEE